MDGLFPSPSCSLSPSLPCLDTKLWLYCVDLYGAFGLDSPSSLPGPCLVKLEISSTPSFYLFLRA